MPISGSGSGEGVVPADPPTCSSTSLRLEVGLFDSIVDSLAELNCAVAEEGYVVVFKSSDVGLEVLESDTAAVFGDYFEYDESLQRFSLEVCTYDILADESDSCSEDMVSVSAKISRHSDRLLPFVGPFADGNVTNADDRAQGVFLNNPIPFWSNYYTSVYVSIYIFSVFIYPPASSPYI